MFQLCQSQNCIHTTPLKSLMMVHIGFGLHTSILPWCTSGLVYIPVSYHGILGVVYIPTSYHGCGLHTNLLPWYFRSGLRTRAAYDGSLSVWPIYESVLHTGSGQQSHSFTTIPIRFSLYTNLRQCYTMVWSMWSCWQPTIQAVYTSGSPTTLHFGIVHCVMLLTAHNAG